MLLSALTHLWNPIGFPTFEQDEGIYLLRTLFVMNGLGPSYPPVSMSTVMSIPTLDRYFWMEHSR
jgi:hypothetical protein